MAAVVLQHDLFDQDHTVPKTPIPINEKYLDQYTNTCDWLGTSLHLFLILIWICKPQV